MACSNTCDLPIITCLPNSNCTNELCKGKNEVWSSCGRNPCAATCDDVYKSSKCTAFACKPGCGCKRGYLRDANSDCVLPKDCPNPVCRKNEVFTECDGHISCHASCVFPKGVPNCITKCIMGCKCKDGYLKNDEGVCISPTDCPKRSK